VWDGDQVLYEIRAEGSDSAQAYAMELDATRVGYTHVLGLDAPAVVFRTKSGVTVGVYPHTDWRGAYDGGALTDGRSLPCSGCVNIHWPGRASTVDGLQLVPEAIGPTEWFGNLIDGKTDGSGQQYMRNRYYDPRTGRFTQVDPIGLAGGINLYGYANGDPITYSDPFGLCAWHEMSCWNDKILAAGAGGGVVKRFATAGASFALELTGGVAVDEHARAAAGGSQIAMVALAIEIGSNAIPGGGKAIHVGEQALAHVIERHGAESLARNASKFAAGEDIRALIKAAEAVVGSPGKWKGATQRIVDAGRTIGVDRATGHTSVYTVVTDAANKLVTAHPGVP
jgi:RHS repeat-associated protein